MEFEEAEAALTEANFLDNFCPVIWGYLALVNIQLGRYDVFARCYLEAKKVNYNFRLYLLKDANSFISHFTFLEKFTR